MRRLEIAISANFMAPSWDRPFYLGKSLQYLESSMAHWIAGGGMLPLLLPDLPDVELLLEAVGRFDGLVLSGGADMAPTSYGEEALEPAWAGDAERDRYEIALAQAFRRAGKPVLGICRGHQVLNVAYGGSLYQDLQTQGKADKPHRSVELYDGLVHRLHIEPGSWLHELYGAENLEINSIHHQGVKELGRGLEACAWSEEGIVEALRDPAEPFVVGVQWHPEWMGPARGDRLHSEPLLEAFRDACLTAHDAPDTGLPGESGAGLQGS